MKGKRWYGTDCESTNEKNENKMTKMNTDVELAKGNRDSPRGVALVPENIHREGEKHDSQTVSEQSTYDAVYATSYIQAGDVAPDESNKSNNP